MTTTGSSLRIREVVEVISQFSEFSSSNAFKDEVHRFAITFTANCAQKFLSSQLDGIDGLGPSASRIS